jgi:leucyl-tRNA synthetase
MSNEVHALALEITLDEIQNTCPDITSNFVFKDGKIIAKNTNTTEEDATQTKNAFNAIQKRADVMGDLENIIIKSAKGKVNIDNMNDVYVTTVSSKEADEKYVNTLTRILIPIVIKISEKIQLASTNNETITLDQTEPEPEEYNTDEVTEEPETAELKETIDEPEEAGDIESEHNYNYFEEQEEETTPIEPETFQEPEQTEPEPEYNDEPLLPEPPATQLIVENLKGFRVPSDTVRFDQEVIDQWDQLFGGIKIEEVEVEALNGKTTRCKFKNIKKTKDSGKGIIKIPEKIQLTLETKEGELVTVKPVFE